MLIRLSVFFIVIITVIFSFTGNGLLEAKKDKAMPEKKAIEPLVVWDGEDMGVRATGWAAPKEEEGGKGVSTLEKKEGTGHDSRTALVWKVKGSEWKGFGWNWFSWWPSDAGTDITMFSHFNFWIKFEMGSRDKGPALDSLNIGLSCSDDGGRQSADVIMVNYVDADIADGKWYEISIPLKDIIDNDASREFNPKTVWEFRMGQWTSFDQDFTAYIDSIGFK